MFYTRHYKILEYYRGRDYCEDITALLVGKFTKGLVELAAVFHACKYYENYYSRACRSTYLSEWSVQRDAKIYNDGTLNAMDLHSDFTSISAAIESYRALKSLHRSHEYYTRERKIAELQRSRICTRCPKLREQYLREINMNTEFINQMDNNAIADLIERGLIDQTDTYKSGITAKDLQ